MCKADILNIRGTETLLTSGSPFQHISHLAAEIGFELNHSRTAEQQCRIIPWHERIAGPGFMITLHKEITIPFTDFLAVHRKIVSLDSVFRPTGSAGASPSQ